MAFEGTQSTILAGVFLAFIILLLNVPFGYWRAGCRKLSASWFTAIHLPVVLGIGLRLISGVPFNWLILPLYVIAFAVGQSIGARVRRLRTS